MARLGFDFDAAKLVARQAGFSGKWRQETNGRWQLPAEEGAGLEWSPTRSKLSAYGSSEARERLEAAVEKALKGNLMASPGPKGTPEADLEVIDTNKGLLKWLIRHMRLGEKTDYPAPLVTIAVKMVEEFSAAEEDEPVLSFQMWSSHPSIGESFAVMTSTCPTRRYSVMLMKWAGRLYDDLMVDEVDLGDALNSALEVAGLEDQFGEEKKGGETYFVSLRTFEERFGVRVQIR